MGVMACDRSGCKNILCNTLVRGEYLCADCLEDLEKIKKKTIAKLEIAFLRATIDETVAVKVIVI